MSDIIYNQTGESVEHRRKFVGLRVDMIPCSYIHGAKAPYYSIMYREDGQLFQGYSSFNIDIVSRFLRDYFIGQDAGEDTREKLEADIRKKQREWSQSPYSLDTNTDEVLGWLDRQAAITEREVRERMV